MIDDMDVPTSMTTCQDQISLLHELALMLENASGVEEILNRALALMATRLGMMRGAITLVDPSDKKIRIRAAYGLKAAEMRRGEYLPGEGVTGKVIESGKAMCISDVAREPLFLNRTRSRNLDREAVSFICVPIRLDGETVGALSADKLLADAPNLENELRLLQIIATMLAPAALDGQTGLPQSGSQDTRQHGFVGYSECMRQVYAQIAQVAPTQANVFLQGESGTGKELAARAIHEASGRQSGPFISLNCAALPENLIESELFGHERGAFTGASQTRKGRFELANGGTLFLDEVGELSLLVQAKLLRVLQEHAFERLGGMHTLHVDVRVIAATNRNLEKMVETGTFRRDLFYRLNVFPIYLPPLRERLEDLPSLADHFLRREARLAERKRPHLSLAAMDMLQRYQWPGNIRELQNAMARAVILLGSGNVVLPAHLPEALRGTGQTHQGSAENHWQATGNLKNKMEEVEKASIEAALETSMGHIGKAALALGMTERVLSLRMNRYGLNYRHFRRKQKPANK